MSERMFPIQSTRKPVPPHPLEVPWSVAELAYSEYVRRYGRCQTLERLAERGGFCASEMDDFNPGWRDQCSEITRLRAEAAELRAQLARVEGERDARIEKLPVTTCDQCQVCGHDIARPCASKDIRLWLQTLAQNSYVTHSIDYLMVVDKRLSALASASAEGGRLRAQLDKIESLDGHPDLSGNERARLVRRIEDKKPELAVEMVWEYATEKCAEWAIAMATTPAPAKAAREGGGE